ncbi:MAG: hypothetical protein CMC31_01095 [Flavobacteriaceae bacterium]|nr:hypothetical protein [Flavobacteriaceae bacterium]|tara:strand:- start:2921 stop:3955 length:1035 start_codon:yes stop_codon:yes gene_type:complete
MLFKFVILLFGLSLIFILFSIYLYEFFSLVAIFFLTFIYYIISSKYIFNGLSGVVTTIPPILVLFSHLLIIYDKNLIQTVFLNASLIFLFLMVPYSLIILKDLYKFKKKNNDNKIYKYIYLRSYQTTYFSFITATQAQVDKLILPAVMSFEKLALYNLIVILPSRLIAVYGNLLNILQRDIYTNNQEVKKIIKNYFYYSSIILVPIILLLLLFQGIIFNQFQISNSLENNIIYILAVIICIFQSYGFISFGISAKRNDLAIFSKYNLYSLIFFIFSIIFISIFSSLKLVLLSTLLLISKFCELLNARRASFLSNTNIIRNGMLYHVIPIILIITLFIFTKNAIY